MVMNAGTVWLRRWDEGDLPLLRLANTDSMTEHLAGPEDEAEILARHERYLRLWDEGRARMFVIMADGSPVGGIGSWATEWDGQAVAETGWFIVPSGQGRGYGRRAVGLLIDDTLAHTEFPVLMAFPAVDNGASNSLCRGAGFALAGVHAFPFRGSALEVNAWALDLAALRVADGAETIPPSPDGAGE